MDILAINNRLPMVEGDFQLVDRNEKVKQHLIAALNTMFTDWLLNYLKGIDFVRGMRQEEFLDNDIKKQILGTEDVVTIKNYTRDFDRENLSVCIKAIVQSSYGKIEINEVIKRD